MIYVLILGMNNVYNLQAENDTERLRYDPHGFLPALHESAATRPPGQRRSHLDLSRGVNFDGCLPPRHEPSSPFQDTSQNIRCLHTTFVYNRIFDVTSITSESYTH